MENILTNTELKKRGMAAIEKLLANGPVHLLKRNQPTAVVLSESEYQHLMQQRGLIGEGLTAAEWLLAQPASGAASKEDIDQRINNERDW